MPDQLFKLLKKRGSNAAIVSPGILAYEEKHPQYSEEIVPLVANDIDVGLEIEVEKVGETSIGLYELWSCRADNSLRHGIEYVSVPMRGPRITYALNQFFDNISNGYSFSPRTSIHVHVNMLPYTFEQVGNIGMVYGVFERLLYRFVGGDRDKNNFCVPLYEAHAARKLLAPLYANVGFQNLEQHRYLGFNLDAIRKFGTLEFRHLGGTDDKKKIVQWINLLFCIVKYATNILPVDLKRSIGRLNTDSNYMAFLNEVFGRECSGLLDQSDLQRSLEGQVSELKTVVVNNKTFINLMGKDPSHAYWWKLLTGEKKKAKTAKRLTLEFGAPPRPARVRGQRQPEVFPALGQFIQPDQFDLEVNLDNDLEGEMARDREELNRILERDRQLRERDQEAAVRVNPFPRGRR